MNCSYSSAIIDKVVSFHGHRCPGLAIGIRAAEYACREFPDLPAGQMTCVTETDMCGIDAIQFLTGCTFGKGNLIHRDYGKMAFTFFDRTAKRGIRLVLNDYQQENEDETMRTLMAESLTGPLSDKQQQQLNQLRKSSEETIMELPLERLFTLQQVDNRAPRPARVMQSLICASCAEKTMESRTRRFNGETLCIPCFEKIEQKQ